MPPKVLDSPSENFSGFKNLKIIYCNGKDVFDSMNAMTEAREYAISTRNPVDVYKRQAGRCCPSVDFGS